MELIVSIVVLAGIVLVAIFAIGLVFSRLYKRASKEQSFVRTGFGGQKVIMNGGALVLPVLHEIIHVNMNTLRLEVRRVDEQSLITKDRMRVDVTAAFYVRVKPTEESIADAAQTLGTRTLEPNALKDLVEGKFVDALRSVAAEMTMSDLQDQRTSFVQKVQSVVSEDLRKNGLELESVSLTGLDQTKREFFNPQNAFDAEGLTRLTEEIETRRKQRNAIEQDAEVSVRQKNLEAEQQKLEISKQEQYLKLSQEQDIAQRTAEQISLVSRTQAEKQREAEEAKILAQQQVDQTRINAERQIKEKDVEKHRAIQSAEIASARAVEVERIEKDRNLQEKEVERQRAIQVAEIEKQKATQLADQTRATEIAVKSKDQSVAEAQANKARADAVREEEAVVTVRETAKAERAKAVLLVEARREAEQNAIEVTVAADADKKAALDKAESVTTLAEADAQAEKIRAEAQRIKNQVEAEGKRIINEALNLLSAEQIAMQVRMELIRQLPEIIKESVKPMERIEGIKIIQWNGFDAASPGRAGPARLGQPRRSARQQRVALPRAGAAGGLAAQGAGDEGRRHQRPDRRSEAGAADAALTGSRGAIVLELTAKAQRRTQRTSSSTTASRTDSASSFALLCVFAPLRSSRVSCSAASNSCTGMLQPGTTSPALSMSSSPRMRTAQGERKVVTVRCCGLMTITSRVPACSQSSTFSSTSAKVSVCAMTSTARSGAPGQKPWMSPTVSMRSRCTNATSGPRTWSGFDAS